MAGGSRRLAVKVAAAGLFAVLAGIITWGASESGRAANLAQENAGLRAELAETREALEALSERITILEDYIRSEGGQVPGTTTVIVEDRRPPAPGPSATTTTTRPSPTTPPPPQTTTTATTEPPCRTNVLGVCIPANQGASPWR